MFCHQQGLVHLVHHLWDVFILALCGVCQTRQTPPPPDKLKECKRNVRRQMVESDVVAVPPKISVPILHAPSCNPLIPAQPVERQSASPSLYLLGPYYISTGMLRAENKGPLA